MAKAIICGSGGGDIDVSNLTASPQDVLEGKTFFGTGSEEPQVGTMVNNDTIKEIVSAGDIYIVPEGYHSGTGSVMGEGLYAQTEGTATEKEILEGKTAWVNGQKLTGMMLRHPGGETTLRCGEEYIVDSGYHDRRVITAQDLASQTEGTALAEDVLEGKTAIANGIELKGAMPYIGRVGIIINCDEEYTVPKGYHDGEGAIQSKSLASQTKGTAMSTSIEYGLTAWVDGEKITGTLKGYQPKNVFNKENIFIPVYPQKYEFPIASFSMAIVTLRPRPGYTPSNQSVFFAENLITNTIKCTESHCIEIRCNQNTISFSSVKLGSGISEDPMITIQVECYTKIG